MWGSFNKVIWSRVLDIMPQIDWIYLKINSAFLDLMDKKLSAEDRNILENYTNYSAQVIFIKSGRIESFKRIFKGKFHPRAMYAFIKNNNIKAALKLRDSEFAANYMEIGLFDEKICKKINAYAANYIENNWKYNFDLSYRDFYATIRNAKKYRQWPETADQQNIALLGLIKGNHLDLVKKYQLPDECDEFIYYIRTAEMYTLLEPRVDKEHRYLFRSKYGNLAQFVMERIKNSPKYDKIIRAAFKYALRKDDLQMIKFLEPLMEKPLSMHNLFRSGNLGLIKKYNVQFNIKCFYEARTHHQPELVQKLLPFITDRHISILKWGFNLEISVMILNSPVFDYPSKIHIFLAEFCKYGEKIYGAASAIMTAEKRLIICCNCKKTLGEHVK